ncbi:MAG TPA: DUF4846 domain-containing protein [Firmicutes bacterium]|nr:DUF4846 domain-containing protein [Bacillota bacterium]
MATTSCSVKNCNTEAPAVDDLRIREQGQTGAESPRGGFPVSESKPNAKSALVNVAGKTVEDRFLTPEGFVRTTVAPGSFGEYLRTLPLKPDGSDVRYYDGRVKSNRVWEAVLDIDVGNRDLQQCADAVIRLRAEYLYKNRRYDQIHFNFANGFRADYKKWMDGYRIIVEGNEAYWAKTAARGLTPGYREFRKYMDVVFAYANTVSLAKEMKPVDVAKMGIGDVFVDSGHAVIVVDMAENKATGKRLFMIAQSYMPAQDIHILKNPANEDLSPWYELDFGETLRTPEWTFTKRDLRSFR